MTNLYESNNYDLSFRGVLANNDFKLYTNNDIISVTSDLSITPELKEKETLILEAASISLLLLS